MNTYFMVKFAKPSKQLIRTTNKQGKGKQTEEMD